MTSQSSQLAEPVKDTIPEYFSGKNIFVTGFTGFIGKYFVQKMLTECPNIGMIYVLIRPSKNKSVEEQFEKTINDPIFNHLKPGKNVLKKLIPIGGDLLKAKLGLSDEHQEMLLHNVSLVYHIAASVRFDMPLTDAIKINVRATRDVCDFVLNLKKCEAFVYISTTYCQLHKDDIDEKLYPSPANWKKVIDTAENMDRFQLGVLCYKYVEGYPNTYTFTKAVAESVVKDLCEAKVPTIVLRPSIVSGAICGVMPGWLTNFNGPIAFMVAHAKGIVRKSFAKEGSAYDIVPVDHVVNAIIKASWFQQYLSPNEISVYNCSSYGNKPTTPKVCDIEGKKAMENEVMDPIWHVECSHTSSRLIYLFNIFLFHFIPALLIDVVMKCLGKPAIFAKLLRRVYISALAVQFFLANDWRFKNDNCENLDLHLQGSDKDKFCSLLVDFDIYDHVTRCLRFIRQYIFKEDLNNKENNLKKLFIISIVHNTVKYATLFYLIFMAWNRLLLPTLDRSLTYPEELLG